MAQMSWVVLPRVSLRRTRTRASSMQRRAAKRAALVAAATGGPGPPRQRETHMRKRLATWLVAAGAAVLVLGVGGAGRAQHPGDDHHAAHDKQLRAGLYEATKRGYYLYMERRDPE